MSIHWKTLCNRPLPGLSLVLAMLFGLSQSQDASAQDMCAGAESAAAAGALRAGGGVATGAAAGLSGVATTAAIQPFQQQMVMQAQMQALRERAALMQRLRRQIVLAQLQRRRERQQERAATGEDESQTSIAVATLADDDRWARLRERAAERKQGLAERIARREAELQRRRERARR